ncbi:MAG TPA: oligosaccharide flippase family protein [Anaerolineae bacterium]|nr:oligosaccharide flippase family protein [Anaerolineae bacterium]HQH37345.1 oligosaccharide flippase family protein [Anaerolineae bacterium]
MLKNILKKFLTYGVGNILQTALRFILLPLYLHFFPAADYGVISVLTTVMGLASLVLSAGVLNGLVRLYYEMEGTQLKKLVGTTWLWYVVVSGIGGLILLTQSSLICQLLFQAGDNEGAVQRLGWVFIFTQLQSVPYNLFRLEKKAGTYVGFSLFSFLADFILKLLFIVHWQRGVEGYFESGAIASGLTLVLMGLFSRRYVRFNFDWGLFKQLLRLGFPYIFSGLAVWGLEVSDRLLLLRFAGEAAVGVYSLSYNLANIFRIVLAAPASLLIDPFFFGYAARNAETDIKALLRRLLVYYCLIGSFVYLMISLGSGDLVRIFVTYFDANPQYLEAVQFVPLVTFAYLLYFATVSGSLAGLLVKKPEVTSTICIIAAAFNIGINFLVLPVLGALGAALTTVAGYLLLDGLLYLRMERIYPVGHDWKALARLAVCVLIALGAGWSIHLTAPWLSLVVKLTVGAVLFSVLTLTVGKVLTPAERTRGLSYLQSVSKKLARRRSNA